MVCCLFCLVLFPALHSGRIGVLATGPPSRDPLPEHGDALLSVRVAGALVAPAAVKNCKKTFGYNGSSLLAELIFGRRLVICEAPVSAKRPGLKVSARVDTRTAA